MKKLKCFFRDLSQCLVGIFSVINSIIVPAFCNLTSVMIDIEFIQPKSLLLINAYISLYTTFFLRVYDVPEQLTPYAMPTLRVFSLNLNHGPVLIKTRSDFPTGKLKSIGTTA